MSERSMETYDKWLRVTALDAAARVEAARLGRDTVATAEKSVIRSTLSMAAEFEEYLRTGKVAG